MHQNPSQNKVFKTVIVGRKNSLDTIKELESLLATLDIHTELIFIVQMHKPDARNYLTKGKLNELQQYIQAGSVDVISVDDELKFSQIRNLQKFCNVPVLDRPRIILEIFSKRAHTKEGKIQVEIATLQRRKAELINQHSSLDQQAGFIGGKGPGEKKIELNRRQLFQRLKRLKRSLGQIEKQRYTKRSKRLSSSVFIVSLVGYTNAGKSTLFNCLTKENIPTDNLLFHTLDTRTRKGFLSPSIGEVLFNDTVGFIRKLPHELIEAFKSTLEEILMSDLIIKVVDVSDKQCLQHHETVRETLEDLGANEIPSLTVLNKMDAIHPDIDVDQIEFCNTDNCIQVSALKNEGIEELKKTIHKKIVSLS
jgi:GTP-binding protein HflX